MNSHGNAEAITMHRHLGEPLCSPCMAYLNRLQREAFRVDAADEVVHLTIAVPRSAYWEVSARADSKRITVQDHITAMVVDSVRSPGNGITFSQERQIRAMWLAKMSTAEIARKVGVAPETVRRRIEKWGGKSNGRAKKPKEKEHDGNDN